MSTPITPTVRIALANGQAERNGSLDAIAPLPRTPHDLNAPALLVSYVYLKPFLQRRERFHYRDWVLDSGAFSAKHIGVTIDLNAYIETCRELLATDPLLTEVFALDVIGDHEASLRNCEAMWNAGVPAIPCFHQGEPESALLEMARTYPKIALGGVVGLRSAIKLAWAKQCFARVWPKRIHGFGFGSETAILALPWHSVDASSWESGPCRFGNWLRYGNMSVRGSGQNLRGELEVYLQIEQKARVRWRKQMEVLDALEDGATTVRLAIAGTNPQRIATLLTLKEETGA